MNRTKVRAYAKLNLTLDILGVKDNYHLIESVVTSINLYDVITAVKRRDNKITVTMHGLGSENIPFGQNNAAIAAEKFINAFSTCGADITVYKNIPIGAGLGGSSADASGTINALARLYNITDKTALKAVADGVGSDCAYMLSGGFAKISGRGEVVEGIATDLKLDIGLLIPRGGVSTARCYALSDGLPQVPRTSGAAYSAVLSGDKVALAASLSNGLYPAAKQLNPDIEGAFSELSSFAPLGVNMTGSGSAVYAIFENDQLLSYAYSRRSGRYTFITTKTVNI